MWRIDTIWWSDAMRDIFRHKSVDVRRTYEADGHTLRKAAYMGRVKILEKMATVQSGTFLGWPDPREQSHFLERKKKWKKAAGRMWIRKKSSKLSLVNDYVKRPFTHGWRWIMKVAAPANTHFHLRWFFECFIKNKLWFTSRIPSQFPPSLSSR